MIEIKEKVRRDPDSGKFGCGIFIDPQKAFDDVNHDILLNKIEWYGLCGTFKSWFKCYLDKKTQLIYLNGVDSEIHIMKNCIPQSYVFPCYINDVHFFIPQRNPSENFGGGKLLPSRSFWMGGTSVEKVDFIAGLG